MFVFRCTVFSHFVHFFGIVVRSSQSDERTIRRDELPPGIPLAVQAVVDGTGKQI